MIQPKELRIGNYIQLPNHTEVHHMQLAIGDINFGGILSVPEEINPIPLTEKWLKKLGYENLSLMDSFYHRSQINGRYDSSIYMGKAKGNEGKFFTDINEEKEIKYVHTLQNYYYHDVLTGEELIII